KCDNHVLPREPLLVLLFLAVSDILQAGQSGSHSFLHSFRIRLFNNRGGQRGVDMIAFACVVGILAYYIAPDHSSNANRIILEIGGKKPGFTMQFLLLPKEKKAKQAGFFERLMNGQEDSYMYLPVQSWQIRKDSIVVDKY